VLMSVERGSLNKEYFVNNAMIIARIVMLVLILAFLVILEKFCISLIAWWSVLRGVV